MRRHLTGLPALLAACCLLTAPAVASASGETATIDQRFAEPPADDDDDELVLDDDDMEAEPEVAPEGSLDPFGEGGDDPLAASKDPLADTDAGAADTLEVATIDPEEQERLDEKLITVTQRQSFLNVYKDDEGKTVRRFEIQPVFALSINDPFVKHYAVGAELDFWITNRFAIGVTGAGFFGRKTPAYDRIRYQTSLLLTANEVLWEASGTLLYEMMYGKVALFNRFLLHWEAYIQGGGGVISTRVLPRYEAIHEPFTNYRGQGNFAIGSRFYVSGLKWMSFNFSVRNFVYSDKYEPPNRTPKEAAGAGVFSAKGAKAQSVNKLTFNSLLYIGVSFYIPPTFQYSTRR